MNNISEEIKRLNKEISAAQKARAKSRFMDKLMENRRDHSANDHFRDSTFLQIRSFSGDTGDRPIPANIVFWNSPDVELFEGDALIATNELKAGNVYKVEVTINNQGDLAATTTTVDLFICNPALALNMANAKQIGITSVEVGAHGNAKVVFKFEAKASYVGHRCLFARAYNAVSKDLPVSADWFDAPNDRHIAQQNLSVVKQGEAFMIELTPSRAGAANISIRQQTATPEGRIKQFRFAKDIKFRTSATTAKFELLHAPARQAITEDTVREFIDSKQPRRPAATGRTAAPVNQPTVSFARVADLKALAEIKQHDWKIETGIRDVGKPVRAILNIPNLALGAAEAAVYLLEVRNTENKVTGGITLVVKG